MIDYIELHHFQSHEHTRIELGSGLNCIIGNTDEGKTSILRALWWVLTNRPQGDSFISDFAPEGACSKVLIGLDGCTEVGRMRGPSKNVYLLDGVEIASGTGGPPLKILQHLNMAPDINIQNWMDPHFMVCSTGSAVAKAFNDALDLSIIDVSMGNAKRRLKETKDKLSILDGQHERAWDTVGETQWAVAAIAGVEQAEQKKNRIDRDYLTVGGLGAVVDGIAECRRRIEEKQEIVERYDADTLGEAFVLVDSIEGLRKQKSRIFQCIKKGKAALGSVRDYRECVRGLEKRIGQIDVQLCPTCGKAL